MTTRRAAAQAGVVGLICIFLGIAVGVFTISFAPDPGSTPAIFDDFNFNSTANGFWHVNAIGSHTLIKHSLLTLTGASEELDHRVQTDPKVTIVSLKIRGIRFHKFGVGLGIYHSGTLGMEFDEDGIRCGRGTDHGYQVDVLKLWRVPPVGQWFYLRMAVKNPYPDPRVLAKLGNVNPDKLKHVTITCSAYDSTGKLIRTITPVDPPANAHYIALDEAFVRTWDHNNEYQIDWFYAGPPTGDPLNGIVRQPVVARR